MTLGSLQMGTRATLHFMSEEDALAEGLEEAKPEQRAVAIRLRRIAFELFEQKQVRLHEAMGGESSGIRRTELNTAWNGGALCRTAKWTGGVATAVGADWPTTRAYLDGTIDFQTLLASRAPKEVSVVPDNLERVLKIAARLGLSASAALDVAEGLRGYKGEITDEEIARRFSPRASGITLKPKSIHSPDDLGGASDIPKLPRRRRK